MSSKSEAPAVEAPAAAPFPKKLVLVMALLMLVMTGATVGGMFYLMKTMIPAGTAAAEEAVPVDADGNPIPPTAPIPPVVGADGKPVVAPHTPPAAAFGPPIFMKMDPPFVVNIATEPGRRAQFLQVQVDLMSRNQEMLDRTKLMDPRIRNDLIMFFARQTRETLADQAAREGLQKEVLNIINRIMLEETGATAIEDVLFTSFVLQ